MNLTKVDAAARAPVSHASSHKNGGADEVATVTAASGAIPKADGTGKLPIEWMPAALIGSMNYQGTWNANTNTPTLSDATGTKGHYYVVSVAGTQDLGSGSVSYAIGDWVVHNGTIYEKIDNTDSVTSVFSRTGAVTAQANDYTHAQLASIGVNDHHAQVHATSHKSGGGDAIKLDDLATPDDNTDLDATTSIHGLLPKLGGGTANYLRADGTWAAPPGGGGGAVTLNEPAADNSAGTQAIFDSGTVGEAVALPDLLYLKSDGKWWKADADAAASMPGLRMALESKTADQICSMLVTGRVRDDDWAWTVGGLIYASTTAGGLTQTAPSGSGDIVQIVGMAYHADKMIFDPSPVTAEVV